MATKRATRRNFVRWLKSLDAEAFVGEIETTIALILADGPQSYDEAD